MANKSLSYFIWMEKYRPQNISGMILPNSLKKYFDQIVKVDKQIPNIILFSTNPGSGKCLEKNSEVEIEISEELYENNKKLFNN